MRPADPTTAATPHRPTTGTPAPAGHLWVAIDALPLLLPRTGVGRFTQEVATRLAARPEVALVAFAATWRGRGALPTSLPPGTRYATRPMAAGPLRAVWRRTEHPRLERWTGPVDVVHGTNFVVPPARGARVVSVHDLAPLRTPELCTPAVRDVPALLRRAVARGAWVHTIPAFVGELADLLGADPERVVGIANGVPPAPEADPAEGRRIAGADRYVCALGTVEPRKDLPTLVAAFDRLAPEHPDVRLVIAGPDGWGADALTAALARSPAADRVTRLGWVEEPQRAALLRGASALAFPSLDEGFGFPPLEAMAAGTPVVATAVGGVPDTVGDAALLVPPSRPDLLADALHQVLAEPALAADLVARGTANLGRFSWERTTDELLDLYRRAAAG